MTREQMKLGLAILFLIGSLVILVVQIGGLRRSDSAASGDSDSGMMDEGRTSGPLRGEAQWTPPEIGMAAALAANPTLRPTGTVAPSSKTARRTAAFRGGLDLSGIRTGEPASVVINDRILEEGETIAGWRVLAIERTRVTLRSSDGKIIRLAASSLAAE